MALHVGEAQGSLHRTELITAGSQIGVIMVLFLVAFFGRDYYGDTARSALIVLSSAAGAVAVGGGLMTLQRALRNRPTRLARCVLAGLQMFIGGYTIVHVLFS